LSSVFLEYLIEAARFYPSASMRVKGDRADRDKNRAPFARMIAHGMRPASRPL
jgi:hypothetical protein